LRSTSDKLKELEKEHGKERRRSVAALSKADQLGLEMEKLRATIAHLQKESEEQQKHLSEKAQIEFDLKEDVLRLKENNFIQEEEIDELRSQIKDLSGDQEKELQKRKDKYENLVTQLSLTTKELRTATGEKVIVQNVLNEKVEKLHNLEKSIHKERKIHKANMEQALNSIVRLCVVAPTVNVQMADQTMSFKAPLPKEKIRHFVQDSVLPKFSVIFQQTADGMSPDGRNLDTWLQNLLVEMQGTIEKHLSKVFNSKR